MKILIAGSSGIIGSYIIKQNKFTDSLALNSKIVNLLSKKETYNFVDNNIKADILVFLVGLAHSKGKNKDFEDFNNVNFLTLKNLLTAFEKFNKVPEKIIFSSTISVYGEKFNNTIYKESIEPSPFTPYAKTKLIAERYLLENYNQKSWILRLAPVYYNNFMLNIDRRIKILNKYFCVGTGKIKIFLCNINNIIKTIDAIIGNKVPHGTYNISDSKTYCYNDLLNLYRPKIILKIPKFLIKIIFLFAKLIKNNFLKENSIKLCTDNIYPNYKINNFVKLSHSLNDIKK